MNFINYLQSSSGGSSNNSHSNNSGNNNNEDNSPISGVPVKRKRLALACNVCRRKKIKCDGLRPACGKCTRLKQECSYPTVVKKRGPKQGHIESLEERLRRMEELLTQSKRNANASGSDQDAISAATIATGSSTIDMQHQAPSTTHAEVSLNETVPQPQATEQQQKMLPDQAFVREEPETRANVRPEEDESNSWPPMDVVMSIVDLYCDYFETMTPIANISRLKESIKNRTCNSFLLYAILSVGARFSNRPEVIENPLWISGEKYAKKARDMIPKVIEEPSIEHIQGILILVSHEYGLARMPRCYTYTGLAVRMAYQLNLHKELMFEDYDIDLHHPNRKYAPFRLTVKEWLNYEDRRRLFWDIYMQDTISSAYAGKPTMMGEHNFEVLLPIYNSTYEVLSSPVEYFQPLIDGRRCVKYAAIRDPAGKIVSVEVTPVLEDSDETNNEDAFMRPLTVKNHIGLEPRIIQLVVLFAKVIKLLNQDSAHNRKEWLDLNQALDDWARTLPVSLRNTHTNLEYFRQHEYKSFKSGQFIINHLLYNTLTVLLNRYAFVLEDGKDTDKVYFTDDLIEPSKVETAKRKCMEAANNVTDILTDLRDQFDIIPPFCIYFIYITSTVIVNSCFSAETEEERKKAKLSLNQCLNVLAGMRNYWATADRTYFVICDFYMLHEKINRQQMDQQQQQKQEEQADQQQQQQQQQPQQQQQQSPLGQSPLTFTNNQSQGREGLLNSPAPNAMHTFHNHINKPPVSSNNQTTSSSIPSPFAIPLSTINSLLYSDVMTGQQHSENLNSVNNNDLLKEALSFDAWLQQQQRQSNAGKQQQQLPK